MAPRPLIKGHPVDCVCWDCWAVVAKRVPAGTKGHPADCVCSRCWPDVEPRRAMPPRNLDKLSPSEREEAIREYEEHKREWQDFRKQPQLEVGLQKVFPQPAVRDRKGFQREIQRIGCDLPEIRVAALCGT